MKSFNIYIIAGEASGDNIGAKLMHALKLKGHRLHFRGIGGEKMHGEGLECIFPMKDLSVMGFVEVIPRIPLITRRIAQTVEDIIAYRPHVLITIDSLGFNGRVVKKVRQALGKTIKVIHYVAPTVWAYKPERVHQIAKLYDHQLLILPFEKPYFDKAGVNSTYVGHPIVEDIPISEATLANYNIPDNAKTILVMPGSRVGEVKRHAPIFAGALARLRAESKEPIYALIPTFSHLEPMLKKAFKKDVVISSIPKDKLELFALADVGLIKSGTSVMEMMLWQIPCIVAYKIHPLTYMYLKWAVKVKYVSIVNLILNAGIVPEFLQGNCTANVIYEEMSKLLQDKDRQKKQLTGFVKALGQLGLREEQSPSVRAANVVMKILAENKNNN